MLSFDENYIMLMLQDLTIKFECVKMLAWFLSVLLAQINEKIL